MPLNPYRTGFVASAEEGARLLFRAPGKESWRLDYSPAPRATDVAEKLNPAFYNQQRYTIIECQRELDVARTFPLNVAASSPGFMQGKYDTLRSITLEGFKLADCQNVEDVLEALQALPSGFVKDPYFGLGINFDIRYIIESIERMDGVSDLRVRKGRRTGLPKVEMGTYAISAASFDEIRKRLRRIHAKALDVAADEKFVLTNNELLHAVDPQTFPVVKRRYRKDALSEALGDGLTKTAGLTAGDRKTAARTTSAVAKTMSQREPTTLLALSRTIETVTLEELIVKMKAMLSKRVSESGWQVFFQGQSLCPEDGVRLSGHAYWGSVFGRGAAI
ncbi:hypothetical protein AS026_05320 [Rhizobium altiplani]|uniref:Uncharacterized protein n=1 Tax=Rhizobium altiplani TaxID=1864509 RepID=A0A109JN65_9HYPH|nr:MULTISPECIES: hypothetical protein [Rhizobium]KWV51991.1 hypothetical protein AS026_05320 [Rhizobium altiplani]